MSNEKFTIADGVVRALGQQDPTVGKWCEVGWFDGETPADDHQMMVKLWCKEHRETRTEVGSVEVESWGEGYGTAIFVLHGLEDEPTVRLPDSKKWVPMAYEPDDNSKVSHAEGVKATSKKSGKDLMPTLIRLYREIWSEERVEDAFYEGRLTSYTIWIHDTMMAVSRILTESGCDHQVELYDDGCQRVRFDSMNSANKLAEWILRARTTDKEIGRYRGR